ncbi:MAG: hypothetical protein K9L79_00465 [Methylobacter tundripaludum]|nr:hypothetical protein [Methylobacter tundripaludum]
MARTPVASQVEQFTDADQESAALVEIRQENNQVAAADAVIMGSFEAIKAIGRIEAAQFSATVSEKLIIETAIKVRESKQYKGLPYVRDGVSGNISTFDEFCEIFLGKTGRRIRDLINNHNLLGEDLYEQAERLGFRQRDYNALKALPSEDRQLIAQAIEEESLDKALDLMQEMAARHVREKDAASKQLTELSETMNAKDKVIKDKTGVIDTQAERIALLENAQRQEAGQPVSAEQRLLDLRSNLQITAADIKTNVMTRLRKAVKELMEQARSDDAFAAACLIEISRELAILRDDYNLPVTVTEDLTPEWMRDGALADIEKQYSGQPLPPVSGFLNDGPAMSEAEGA